MNQFAVVILRSYHTNHDEAETHFLTQIFQIFRDIKIILIIQLIQIETAVSAQIATRVQMSPILFLFLQNFCLLRRNLFANFTSI